MEKDFRDSILQFNEPDNVNRYTARTYITPRDKKISSISDFITISLFEFSNDFVGISFCVNLSENIKQDINKLINSNCKGKEEFVKYY